MAKGLTTLPASANVDDVVEVIDRDGGVIVEDMLSPELLERFFADIGPYLERTPYGEEGFTGNKTRRCSALMAKSLHTAEFLTQKHFHGAAEKILLQQPYKFVGVSGEGMLPTLQLSVTQAIQIWPGQGAQSLHRDDAIHHRPHPGPESQVQVIYAGTRFTAENGATLVVPGSHKWDNERLPKMEEAVPAVMKKGSGLIYLGGTYHAGGLNTTEAETRTAIAISLTLGYLRQEENQYLVVPKETVLKYPPHIQQLLGYSVCPPFCGWVEMQSPAITLENEDFSVATATNLY
ncbi:MULTISPECIES: phytanoyl-CoA dioxygenase family protein [Caballeronia]|uniref:phytanoyl-CoA dioxygenase family protein n=1 Tax=Caballeronia TaxID=1827195 RepID=UPI001FD230AF|nr:MULTISPECIES: phytanoyl-CoA dioxygenase family protein [Caballeronia]MDR5799146.1 phytanoyl-CoA dioxygenase family protein [Caballeronia sp. LZ001]